jgi:serine/threonine protein kinase/serine/threonine protein phosphatase PrpC
VYSGVFTFFHSFAFQLTPCGCRPHVPPRGMSRASPAPAPGPMRFFFARAVFIGLCALVIGVLRAFDLELPRATNAPVNVPPACGRARGRRRAQEDACVIGTIEFERIVRFVGVFDGHDGDEASTTAAGRLSQTLEETLATSVDVADAVRATVKRMDEDWNRVNSSSSAGTTVVIAASDGSDGFVVAHAGDSAAHACFADVNGRVRARKLTNEHGPNDRSERARLLGVGVDVVDSRGHWRVGGEFLVTRAIGGAGHKKLGIVATPEVTRGRWRDEDFGIIVTSDGTMERLRADEVCDFVFGDVRECKSAEAAPVITLDGAQGSSEDVATDVWDEVTIDGSLQKMREDITRALKCALERGSSDNVALGAISSGRLARRREQRRVFQRAPSDLVAEVPQIGSKISAYEVREMVAWSSGPYFPAETPFRHEDDFFVTDAASQLFEQSAIEGALAALALAPGVSEDSKNVLDAITSYVDIVENHDEKTFTREKPFARGHFGEVWRARMTRATDSHQWECKPDRSTVSDAFLSPDVIMKRILIDQGVALRLSAEREIHFGKLLCGASPHLARFLHSFESAPTSGRERWLVFQDEGESLERLMYAPQPNDRQGGFQLVTQSDWWRAARSERGNGRTLKTILRHVFAAVNATHSGFGVIHRDIKPANVFVRIHGDLIEARLGDFGSAVDAQSRAKLYGDEGPTSAQETSEYSPPEVLFGNDSIQRTEKYDMWSLGVMMAEILTFGSPRAFSQISRKTRLTLERELRGVHPQARLVAYRLRAMLELCIVPPDTQVAPLLSWECTETALMNAFKERDPLGVGFESVWALRLVRKLLSWDPGQRPSAARVLEHAYFRDSDDATTGWTCGAFEHAFEWKSECEASCAETCA